MDAHWSKLVLSTLRFPLQRTWWLKVSFLKQIFFMNKRIRSFYLSDYNNNVNKCIYKELASREVETDIETGVEIEV